MFKINTKGRILIILIVLNYSCKSKEDCPNNINLLPMYGDVEKCKSQIESDKKFVLDSEIKYKTKNKACEFYIAQGWEYFYANENDLSMKRFNQAWLLDKNNPEIYWGFGNILGQKNEYEKSIKYLLKSIKLDSNNAKVYESISTSYGNIFNKNKDIKYLNLTIENLEKAAKLDSSNGRIYGQLANSYYYFTQKDSLKKYIEITDKIDPSFISPELRARIKKN